MMKKPATNFDLGFWDPPLGDLAQYSGKAEE
jgi:hypothetical protein